jgi:hypothetical protein
MSKQAGILAGFDWENNAIATVNVIISGMPHPKQAASSEGVR